VPLNKPKVTKESNIRVKDILKDKERNRFLLLSLSLKRKNNPVKRLIKIATKTIIMNDLSMLFFPKVSRIKMEAYY